MRVVYIDSLFLINLIINYLLLSAVCRICANQVRKVRMLLASLIGAVYAVMSILQGLQFMQHPLIKVAFGVLMLICAFGGMKGLLKIGLVFIGVAAAFGGIVMAVALLGGEIWTGSGIYIPISLRALLLSIGMAYGLLTLVFRFMAAGKGTGGYATLAIIHGGRDVKLTALKDTGNSLRDPVTGMPVPIVDSETACRLFDRDVCKILSEHRDIPVSEQLELIWQCAPQLRFRLMSYSAVGVKSSMLLSFKPDMVKLNGREMKGMWIAISPTKVSDTGAYSALVNGEV